MLLPGLVFTSCGGGTDGVGGGVGRAAQQAVGHPHRHQHGAEIVALLQRFPGRARHGVHSMISSVILPLHLAGNDDLGGLAVRYFLHGLHGLQLDDLIVGSGPVR